MNGLAAVIQHHSLDDLASALHRAEAELENARINYETLAAQLADVLGYQEKPVTFDADDHTIETRANYVRSVDRIGVASVAQMLDDETVAALFPLRHVLDVSAYLDLKETDPARFEIASRAVTLLEKRPAVSVTPRGVAK